ncbi:hypothetical protein HDU97_002174 [Phlyctochytrium planicorne]|nr:hypothetical protein HDU97_002174 [Phlyctochytrium planicorne]
MEKVLGDWYWTASSGNDVIDDLDPEFDLEDGDLQTMYQSKAIEAWKRGASVNDLHCLNRMADHCIAEDRVQDAVGFWEKASEKGDVGAAKALVKVHEMRLREDGEFGGKRVGAGGGKGTKRFRTPWKNEKKNGRKDSEDGHGGRSMKRRVEDDVVQGEGDVLVVEQNAGETPAEVPDAKDLGDDCRNKAANEPAVADGDDPADVEDDEERSEEAPPSPRTIAVKYLKYSEIAASTGDPSHLTQYAHLNLTGLDAIVPSSDSGTSLSSPLTTPKTEILSLLPRNPPLALELLLKAHASGAPSSASILSAAHILMQGDLGIQRNPLKALELYAEAAREGSIEGLVAVGDAFAVGMEGLEPDLERAFRIFEEAEKVGCLKACWKLGDCYREGVGCDVDFVMAFKLYAKAAEGGDHEGIKRLAQCYWMGEGCYVDLVEAERLMKSLPKNEFEE